MFEDEAGGLHTGPTTSPENSYELLPPINFGKLLILDANYWKIFDLFLRIVTIHFSGDSKVLIACDDLIFMMGE